LSPFVGIFLLPIYLTWWTFWSSVLIAAWPCFVNVYLKIGEETGWLFHPNQPWNLARYLKGYNLQWGIQVMGIEGEEMDSIAGWGHSYYQPE
jgi:hypothetical protein